MKITMNTNRITSIGDVENFLQTVDNLEIVPCSQKEKYHFVSDTLVKFSYRLARKKNKTLIKRYLAKVTGYSKKQIKRLIKKWKAGKLLASLSEPKRNSFPCIYGPGEIKLLAEADEALNFPNGPALKRNLLREFEFFKKENFQVISRISISHIYNLRKNSNQYQSAVKHYTKTKAVSTPIGERRKPNPYGKPGYIRIDSVHQGDLDKEKGVYHINIVDEVTQWEIVGCVEGISEKFMLPLLKELFKQFPFEILNFHSDNGSEYINYQVADLLNRLLVSQTKSRARRSNDNALAETKNGAVIRKHIGRNHIAKRFAPLINDFYREHFNPFLNFHRICGFATDYTDKRGKIKKKYDIYLTPYEKFKLLDKAFLHLKKGITFEILDKIAYAQSDVEAGEKMREEKFRVFEEIQG